MKLPRPPTLFEGHEFCDHCPGCRPGLLDINGNPLPMNHPMMITVMRVWNEQTSYAERKAFIEVTLHNSTAPQDRALAREFMKKCHAALQTQISS